MEKAKLISLPKGGVTYRYKFQHDGETFSGSTGCADKKEAFAFAKAMRDRVRAEGVLLAQAKGKVPSLSRDMTFLLACNQFWRLTGSSVVNAKADKVTLFRIVEMIGAKTMVSEIGDLAVYEMRAKLRAYIDPRTGKNLLGATINQYFRLLRRVLTFTADKVLETRLRKISWCDVWHEEGQRKRTLTIDEQRAMFDNDSPYSTVAMFGIACGIRKTSLIELRWEQVDLEGRTLTVPRKLSRKRSTSNRASTYTVHLTNSMIQTLRDQLPHKEAGQGQVWTMEPTRTCFNAKASRQFVKGVRMPMHVWGFHSWYNNRAKRLNLDITVHDLRRTTGNQILAATGGSIAYAQKVLDHSTPTITAKIYAHCLPNDLRDALDKAAALTNWQKTDKIISKSAKVTAVTTA